MTDQRTDLRRQADRELRDTIEACTPVHWQCTYGSRTWTMWADRDFPAHAPEGVQCVRLDTPPPSWRVAC